MKNINTITLAFDLDIIKDIYGEPVYINILAEREEGDVMISKDLFKEIFSKIFENSGIIADNPIRVYLTNDELYTAVNKYKREVGFNILNDNMNDIVQSIESDLRLLELVGSEKYTLKLNIKLTDMKVSFIKATLYDPNNEEDNNIYILKILYFLYLYFNRKEEDIIYNLVIFLVGEEYEIFNLFTGDLEKLFNYGSQFDYLNDDDEVVNISYLQNFVDNLIYSFNATYNKNNYVENIFDRKKYLN